MVTYLEALFYLTRAGCQMPPRRRRVAAVQGASRIFIGRGETQAHGESVVRRILGAARHLTPWATTFRLARGLLPFRVGSKKLLTSDIGKVNINMSSGFWLAPMPLGFR
jgi:hypothetical protein